MAKIALLIGVSEYQPGLNPLPGAVKDVEAMQQVLIHPEIGGFAEAEVTMLKNPPRQDMENAIYELFANRKKDDLLLFYFSGHGITDKVGQFYLATPFTRKDKTNQLIDVTAVAANLLHQKMNNSRSEQQVVILDCCFSGAFATGMTAKSDGTVNIQTQLGGKGRAVLASSTSTQYSFEHKQSGFSIYTYYLLEGLQEGKADGDSDGCISVNELHEYASDKVRKYCLDNQISPPMSPEIYAVKEGYKIHLAKAPAPIIDGKLLYLQEAKSRIVRGTFSSLSLRILEAKRVSLGLSEDEAAAVRNELERPYREYEEALQEAINQEYPLSNATEKDLKDYQQILGLLDDDIREIEQRVLMPKQAEYELVVKQREEQRQAEEKAAQLKQQQKAEKRQQELEQLKQQEKAAQLKQQEEELEKRRQQLERLNKPQIVSTSQTANTQPKIQTQSFEFEVATFSVVKTPVKKPGWFGFGEKIIGEEVSYEINRSRKQAKFFTENLGNGVKLEMVAIPGGKFLMGSPTDEPGYHTSQSPQHSVIIKPFFMGKFAVTQAQWQAVASFPKIKIDLKSEPSCFKGPNRPVERINWYEAEEFCARLSQKTGRIYQLPSESQWEYACRAGTTTPFHFGETITTDLANYCGEDRTIEGTLYKGSYANSPKGIYRQETTDVGSFPANAFGLYDMHGNLWEWCGDHWHKNYENSPNDVTIWLSSDGSLKRLLRGGSWFNVPVRCRSAFRYFIDAGYGDNTFGFRVMCAAAWT